MDNKPFLDSKEFEDSWIDMLGYISYDIHPKHHIKQSDILGKLNKQYGQ